MLRISLLAGEMRSMHLSSSGALLSGAASIRLYQLVASVLTLLFTTSAIVRLQLLTKASLLHCERSQFPPTCLSCTQEVPCLYRAVLHNYCAQDAHMAGTPIMQLDSLPGSAASCSGWVLLQVHLVERIPFFDALYFVTTTLTTVGYGDVVAVSVLGKAAVLAMILVGVVLIPVQTSQLYSQLTARRLTLGAQGSPRRHPEICLGGQSSLHGIPSGHRSLDKPEQRKSGHLLMMTSEHT